MKLFRVHKTRGTTKIVCVEAERVEFKGGAATFWIGGRLVMAYSPWAWKSISEEIPSETPVRNSRLEVRSDSENHLANT